MHEGSVMICLELSLLSAISQKPSGHKDLTESGGEVQTCLDHKLSRHILKLKDLPLFDLGDKVPDAETIPGRETF